MKVVVDTNILFSALLKEGHHFADTLQLSEEIEFFIPKYAIVEIFKYKDKIVKYSKLPEAKILEALHTLLKSLHVFDEELITAKSLRDAYERCKDIDEKDMIFVALALELDAKFWTGDQKLVKGLNEKGVNNFFTQSTE